MKRQLNNGDILRHFKGKLYQIVCEAEYIEDNREVTEAICCAEHTENGEQLIIYRSGNKVLAKSEGNSTKDCEKLIIYKALYHPFKTYARPEEMFNSKVDKVKYTDIKQEYRFELIKDQD